MSWLRGLSDLCLIVAMVMAAFLFYFGGLFSPTWSLSEASATALLAMQIEKWLELVISPLLVAIVFALLDLGDRQ